MNWKKSSKVASIDSGEDSVRVNRLFVHLSAQKQGVRHEVVHNSGITLGVAVEGGKSGGFDDSFGATGAQEFVADIVSDFGVGQAGSGKIP